MQAKDNKQKTAAGRRLTQADHSADNDLALTVQGWLNIQCGMVSGVSRGLVFLVEADTDTPDLLAGWPQGTIDFNARVALILAAAESGNGHFEPQPGLQSAGAPGAGAPDSSGLARFYQPITVSGGEEFCLVVVLEMENRSEIEQRTVINLLRWGGEWLNFSLSKDPPVESQDLSLVFQMAATCLDQQTFHAMGMTLVTELTSRFSCQRASLGFRKGKHSEVYVLSHSSRFEHHSKLMRTIGTAMDEAIDQDRVIVYADEVTQASTITYAHAELAQHMDKATLCTLPFTDRNEIIGALTLERNTGIAFDAATVQQIEQLLAVIAPVLVLRRRDEQALPVKVWRAVRSICTRILGPGHIGLKVTTVASVLLILFFGVAQGNWRVTADAVVEGSVQQVIAAPIDGYIASAAYRAGDIVKQDQELGALDDSDLKLQHLKWSTLRQQMVRENREAMAQHNLSEVSIIGARIEQADAELQLLDEHLSRIRILSPFDGIVIEGDLSQRLGTPVTRGDLLFKVAPLDDYRIVLNVDEKDIAPIRVMQTGKLLLASMPDHKLDFQIEKITSVSVAEEGRNFFRVEARFLHSDVSLRPGMEGVGKIEVGEENLFWIWTRDLSNWLRLQAWTWWR